MLERSKQRKGEIARGYLENLPSEGRNNILNEFIN